MPVRRRVVFRGFVMVVFGLKMVTVRHVCVMRRGLVIAGFVMFCGLFVMMGRMFAMLGGVLVMLRR